ncbi:MAG: (Fe-S)-binding protein [Desulfobacterales bacterium]|jgi:Fe-S oxidoreductase
MEADKSMGNMKDIIQHCRAWYCQECGKCSAVCPITRWETRSYSSPRLLVEKAVDGQPEKVMQDPLFWSCLTCQRCSLLCPSDVHFSDFMQQARTLATSCGHTGECTHGAAIQNWGKMMTEPGLAQNRLDWITPELQVSDNSEIVYFTGCLPYYDAFFKHLDIEGIDIARAALKILNHLEVTPQVMADERCCGHDQLWEGDMQTFQALAERNLEALSATGAKTIVTTCPECAFMLTREYPKRVADHGMAVFHLAQYLAQAVGDGNLVLQAKYEQRVTYHDPCRLGRYLNIYDEPRSLMAAMGLDLREMERVRSASLCCGTTGWTSCGQVSKNIQTERLQEASQTGVSRMITACVKCQIHFRCAQQDQQLEDKLNLEIQDLTTLIANHL